MVQFINRVELRGNVGGDPRLTVKDDGQFIRFSLATNETFRDRAGVLKEETTWHNIIAWSNKNNPDLSEIKKGSHISIAGKIRVVKYKSNSDEERQITEIVALKISFPKIE